MGQGGAVQGISRGALAKMVSRVNEGPNIWQVGVGTTRDYTDRGLALEKWLELYPEARVTHKILSGFDHTALLLIVHPTHTRWKGRFVYDLQWGQGGAVQGISRGALAKMVSRVNGGPNIWQVGVGTTRDYTVEEE
ncbi:unnamed protein product [Prunus armeniaca]|uniref:Uncharacterized protein n=1 Tax=Prunus armeniaca TaxID=36596 RepID=A0A6J5Y008_PRUAR|nr:unnamed protein product [Prunus armeniaca]